jgi:hypothetical protein
MTTASRLRRRPACSPPGGPSGPRTGSWPGGAGFGDPLEAGPQLMAGPGAVKGARRTGTSAGCMTMMPPTATTLVRTQTYVSDASSGGEEPQEAHPPSTEGTRMRSYSLAPAPASSPWPRPRPPWPRTPRATRELPASRPASAPSKALVCSRPPPTSRWTTAPWPTRARGPSSPPCPRERPVARPSGEAPHHQPRAVRLVPMSSEA